MKKIVIPDDFPPMVSGSKYLEMLKPFGEVVVYSTMAENEEKLTIRLENAWALINVRAYTQFTRKLIMNLPELEIISILGTGTDHVDLEAATDHCIVVTNTPAASTVSVAEHAFALLIDCARFVALGDRKMRQEEWYHSVGFELEGKTLGLVGLGLIARHMAKIGKGFGMNVVSWSRTKDEDRARRCGVKLVELNELLRISDFISIHLRLTEETKGIIGEREFGLMKPNAILVNTARGAIVDEQALVSALSDRKITAAGLDVFDQEPLPHDHPLLSLDNAVLTPHVGWVTHEASERLKKMPVDNIINYRKGKPTFVVNPEVLK